MIRSFELYKLTENDPWDSVLAATMFAVQTTVHTLLQALPTQLVFGRNTILNIPLKQTGSTSEGTSKCLSKRIMSMRM